MMLEKAKRIYKECVDACLDSDDEAAHAKEDNLRLLAIQSVLENDPDYLEICRLSLKTNDLEFARWCA